MAELHLKKKIQPAVGWDVFMSSGGFCESFKMFSKVAVLVLGSLSLIPLATSTGDLSEFISRMDEDFYNCCASNPSATSGDPLVSFGALHTYGAQQFLIVLLLIPFTIALLVATWRSKQDEGIFNNPGYKV